MNAIKTFASAAPAAVAQLLAGLTPSQAEALERQFQAGNRLALSFAVDATGESSVILEMVDSNGGRRWIAAANGVPPASGPQAH